MKRCQLEGSRFSGYHFRRQVLLVRCHCRGSQLSDLFPWWIRQKWHEKSQFERWVIAVQWKVEVYSSRLRFANRGYEICISYNPPIIGGRYGPIFGHSMEEVDRQQRVGCRRPENKNLLVASGCFNMILKGFMSKNTRPIIVKSKMLVLK